MFSTPLESCELCNDAPASGLRVDTLIIPFDKRGLVANFRERIPNEADDFAANSGLVGLELYLSHDYRLA
jgi:hypothetical protein